ncbi:hypothetical protein BJV78DRAFT_1175127 [Lactifluus subvellereus]|nr:hypothetical protein BJV78DRAFT_1252443 [Lactifluus subvellereus]KAI0256017.1 hypothetical protein BJV78DRAFT_1175127 [Lactifluus subvellereus]
MMCSIACNAQRRVGFAFIRITAPEPNSILVWTILLHSAVASKESMKVLPPDGWCLFLLVPTLLCPFLCAVVAVSQLLCGVGSSPVETASRAPYFLRRDQ